MSTRTQVNRIQRLACNVDARTHAQHAALHGEPFTVNPYPVGSFFWCVWCATYEDTIHHLVNDEAERHERELAAKCLAEGDIGAAESIADDHDAQPVSFIDRMVARLGELLWRTK